MDSCNQRRVVVWQALEARSYFHQSEANRVQARVGFGVSLRTFNEIFSFKAPVRLLPCDHTSEDQMVELGRTNGTKQLVSFSLKLQLLPGPGQPTVLAS